MADLRGPAEAYASIPPAVDGVVIPTRPEDAAGARKVAAAVAGLFQVALGRAAERYELGELVTRVSGAPWKEAQTAAVAFVYQSTERAALKHGLSLPDLPYQDEIVALGAAGASVVYLFAEWRGTLPEPPGKGSDGAAAPPGTSSPVVDVTADGGLPDWMQTGAP